MSAATADAQDLFEAAKAAQANAHAPYSHYRVGAAVRSASGRIYAGCNVENAAYPEGWCAETSAIGAMVSAGERVITEVLTITDGDEPGTCCGGCRQRIREFAGPNVRVHAATAAGIQATFAVSELLPHSFGPEQLADS